MNPAKSALPNAVDGGMFWSPFARITFPGICLFTTAPGVLSDEGLAHALEKQGRPVLWLRLGSEDRDPATLLLSLIAGARRLQPGIGSATLEKMRLSPGPLMGWPALYRLLAQELAEGLPAAGAFVLEYIHHLSDALPTLELLSGRLLANLPRSTTQILTSYQTLPAADLSRKARQYSGKDLRFDEAAGRALAQRLEAGLPDECIRKAVRLLDGRGVALAGVFATGLKLRPSLIQKVILNSKNADQLLTQLARLSLSDASTDELHLQRLALQLDYSHSSLSQIALGFSATPDSPWMQPLSDGWQRLRCTWEAPLQAAFRGEQAGLRDASIVPLAEYLARSGAVAEAVKLCFSNKNYPTAARIMNQVAESMMDLGQWTNLESWLNRLPREVLHDWPNLVYFSGEMAAAHGRLAEARRIFAISSELFYARGEHERTCHSLLAESALAAWEDDRQHAVSYAQSAETLARQAGLGEPLGHAGWQLAGLSAHAGAFDEALAYISQAAATKADPSLTELFLRAANLLQRQVELQVQSQTRYQTYLEILQAEDGNRDLLRRLLDFPAPNLPDVFARLGWSHTPIMLKMPAPPFPPAAGEEDARQNILPIWPSYWLQKLSAALGRSEIESKAPELADGFFEPILNFPASAEIFSQSLAETLPPDLPPIQPNLAEPPAAPASAEEPPVDRLLAYLLGPFQLSVNKSAPVKLPGSRGLGVLKYLLIHYKQAVPREVLMDTFWQEAGIESARNTLNVAMHHIRRTLRSITPLPVILFENGSYRLNPDLHLWTDVDEFEQHIHIARQLEQRGQAADAIREYEAAASLYQGDLLEEDPYEEWVVFERERLRIAYLDMLDHLSQIYFNREEYMACIAMCQGILSRDNCREDAHRRLMRCYSRQGQPHLALRQYQTCIQALHNELDVEPAEPTLTLYQNIRNREPV